MNFLDLLWRLRSGNLTYPMLTGEVRWPQKITSILQSYGTRFGSKRVEKIQRWCNHSNHSRTGGRLNVKGHFRDTSNSPSQKCCFLDIVIIDILDIPSDHLVAFVDCVVGQRGSPTRLGSTTSPRNKKKKTSPAWRDMRSQPVLSKSKMISEIRSDFSPWKMNNMELKNGDRCKIIWKFNFGWFHVPC